MFLSLYLTNINNLPDQASLRSCITGEPDRQNRPSDSFLTQSLGHHTDTIPCDWRIHRSADGKPSISKGPDRALRISLAHSGPFMLAGITDSPAIGVDIECIKKRHFTRIAAYLDWPQAGGSRNQALQSDPFYHLWTVWESLIKLSGVRDTHDTRKRPFENITSQFCPGNPGSVTADNQFALSWCCPETFWISAIIATEAEPELKSFMVEDVNNCHEATSITAFTASEGIIDPAMLTGENRKQHHVN